MTERSVAVDGNSIGFQAYNGPVLRSGAMETQAVFGVIRAIRKLIMTNADARVWVAWDGESWRKSVSSEYKANRETTPALKKMKDGYSAQKPYIVKALSCLGVRQVIDYKWEADDIIAAHAYGMRKEEDKTLKIVSIDKDLLQLVSKNTCWYNPLKNITIYKPEFAEYTGYETPQAFVQGKALMGDPSDNLKGVGGIGKVGAEKLLREYGSVPAFVKAYRAGEVGKVGKKLKEFAENTHGGIDIFKNNFRLMQLLNPSDFESGDGIKHIKREIHREKFEDLCSSLAFLSILKEFDNFLEPFEVHYDNF